VKDVPRVHEQESKRGVAKPSQDYSNQIPRKNRRLSEWQRWFGMEIHMTGKKCHLQQRRKQLHEEEEEEEEWLAWWI
jgi:hypothetical protein